MIRSQVAETGVSIEMVNQVRTIRACGAIGRALPGTLGLLAAAIVAGSTGGAGPATADARIIDPYENGSGRWYRGQLHMHSTTHKSFVHADSLRDKVERYRDAGYDFACVTDHNFDIRLPGVTLPPLPTRDPEVPGILFISGVEVGFISPRPGGLPPLQRHVGGIGMDWSVSRGDSLFRVGMMDSSSLGGGGVLAAVLRGESGPGPRPVAPAPRF